MTPPDPLLDLFRRTMEATFEEVVHGPPEVPEKAREHRPGIIESKIRDHNLVVNGRAIWDATGEYLMLTVTRNGWSFPGLGGRVNLTDSDFIGWCSLVKTVMRRSYTPPEETGESGIYRVTKNTHLRTVEGNLFLPRGRIVALLNSNLLCDLGSSHFKEPLVGIEKSPWVGAMKVPHPNLHPDFWHRVGWGLPGMGWNQEVPTLEILIEIDILTREFDGDDLIKDLPREWHTWREGGYDGDPL